MPQTRIRNETSIKLSDLLALKTSWTDTSFPTSDFYWTDFSAGVLKSQKVTWKRGKAQYSTATYLGSSPSYFDVIDSANFDDEYFLVGIAAISAHTSLLKSVITTQDYNTPGVFSVNMWHRGMPTTVNVDDQLPIKSNAFFSAQKPTSNAIWTALLEKAAAKFYGSYEALSDTFMAGYSGEAFDIFLGVPVGYITQDYIYYDDYYYKSDHSFAASDKMAENDTDDDYYYNYCYYYSDSNYEEIKSNFERGFPQVAYYFGYDAKYNFVQQEYAIVGVYEVASEYGYYYNTRLIQLYNPSGADVAFDYWSDSDTMYWTDAAKAQIADYINNAKDGSFFVEEYDFACYFSAVEVAYYHSGFVNSMMDVKGDEEETMFFEFTTSAKGKTYVGVDFASSRQYAYGCDAFAYGTMTLMTKGGVTITTAYTSNYEGFNFIEIDSLAAGTYVLTVTNEYYGEALNEFTVRLYGTNSVTFSKWNTTQIQEYNRGLIKIALQLGYFDYEYYSSYADEAKFSVIYGYGPSFSLFELSSYDEDVNVNVTFYLGDSVSTIYSTESQGCTIAKTSPTYGNYVSCMCKMSATKYSLYEYYASKEAQELEKDGGKAPTNFGHNDLVSIHSFAAVKATATAATNVTAGSATIYEPSIDHTSYCTYAWDGFNMQWSFVYNE